ncbi:MAG TPA: PD-(D/E)XK nuclease family protein, partial [Chthoniobacteraceae bacterium]
KAERRAENHVSFHSPDDHARTLDLGSDLVEEHRRIADREKLAEQMRLLYVALTRARLQTHFAWGRFNKCEVSAANWLLHHREVEGADPIDALHEQRSAASDGEWRGDLDALAAAVPDSIAIVDLPPAEAPAYRPASEEVGLLSERKFRGAIERDWRIASFSSLTASGEVDQPDFDRIAAPVRAEVPVTGIHAFPRGTRAGICLHEIFEELDFQSDAAIDELVARKLTAFNFDAPEHRTSISTMVRRTLAAPLAPGLSFDQVGRQTRLDELEFYFPFSPLKAEALAKLLGSAPTAAGRLQFEPQRGFIKGFIDLLFEHDGRFYIVDWKSNWLGADADAYSPDAVRAEMTRHHYVLQYHLYTLAVHRFLAVRRPEYSYERDFGGVIYLFLRGLEAADAGHGIFHDQPEPRLIDALDALFSGNSATGGHR